MFQLYLGALALCATFFGDKNVLLCDFFGIFAKVFEFQRLVMKFL